MVVVETNFASDEAAFFLQFVGLQLLGLQFAGFSSVNWATGTDKNMLNKLAVLALIHFLAHAARSSGLHFDKSQLGCVCACKVPIDKNKATAIKTILAHSGQQSFIINKILSALGTAELPELSS